MGTIETSSASETGLPTRILGRTGARVSILGLGGWHIGAIKDEAEAIQMMHTAIDEGLTFFDNSWCYHDGHAEEVMGKALATGGRRERVFLMTKNCERDYAGSMKCLEDSLRRLKTDHLDLWQFHECIYDNDPDWIFDRGGIDAALEAQRQGKIRFIGFTGHKDPRLHTKMLSKPHEWDATQMPVNVMDTVYRSYQQEVLPECLKRGIGVIGMKALGGGYPQGTFLKSAGLTAEECYRFALSQSVSVQVCGINSMEHLLQDIEIGRSWKPMPEDEAKTLVARVREEAGDGRHELFKSTTLFDGPHHVKQHGFAASST